MCEAWARRVVRMITGSMRRRTRFLRFSLLGLVFAVTCLSAFLSVRPVHLPIPDVDNDVQSLNTWSEIVPFGPRILGLHVHVATPIDSRTFRVSIQVGRLPLAGSFRPNLPIGSLPYAVHPHYGQSIGLDRWFAEAILPVKPTVILLC